MCGVTPKLGTQLHRKLGTSVKRLHYQATSMLQLVSDLTCVRESPGAGVVWAVSMHMLPLTTSVHLSKGCADTWDRWKVRSGGAGGLN
jgi:hypothetical protein